jgi:hypothetical protein
MLDLMLTLLKSVLDRDITGYLALITTMRGVMRC